MSLYDRKKIPGAAYASFINIRSPNIGGLAFVIELGQALTSD